MLLEKNKALTASALLTAVTIVLLTLNYVLPFNTGFLFLAASCMPAAAVIKGSFKYGCLVYAASSLLSFFMLPFNISLLYILFFGLYPLIKYYIEKFNSLYKEIPLKLVILNILFFMNFSLFSKVIFPEISVKINFIFIICVQAVFLIYDYVLTMCITFFRRKIKL